ncbi:Protein of unknown function DUF104 [Thermococcus thioreducens]|uniref:Antitoxin n=2 Tax=Thermococcus thioreducens TaxID=277988 RepID=A0A1I0MA81_9EURY|nr:Protein of unknown function DUF104 [Thermococcus thioreducens]
MGECMSEVIPGIYRKGELILIDGKELHEGDTITVRILTRKELVERLAGILGEGRASEVEEYLEELNERF